MAWKVYAIRSGDGGWPPEVWVVFASVEVAREYVERALCAFGIETMPVYESHEECPTENRGLSARSSALALQSLGWAESDGDRPTWRNLDEPGAAARVVYAVAAQDSECWDYTEVELFYATRSAAEEHVAHSYCMAMVVPFVVYRRYADCPADRRFDGSGRPPGWSQLLRPKRC
jgi:hypothetical protein